LLGGYRGIVQCDGYNAYKQLAGPARDGPPVTLAICWSHVRRGFCDPAKPGNSPIAEVDLLILDDWLMVVHEPPDGRVSDPSENPPR